MVEFGADFADGAVVVAIMLDKSKLFGMRGASVEERALSLFPASFDSDIETASPPLRPPTLPLVDPVDVAGVECMRGGKRRSGTAVGAPEVMDNARLTAASTHGSGAC